MWNHDHSVAVSISQFIAWAYPHVVRALFLPYKRALPPFFFVISCARALLSPVRFLPRHSHFADCKLYIRTRLLASAFSNFWKSLHSALALWIQFGSHNYMALITISGYPCSGKTTRALQIKHLLVDFLKDPTYNGPLRSVELISDDHLNLNRAVYDRRSCCNLPRLLFIFLHQRVNLRKWQEELCMLLYKGCSRLIQS